MSSSTPLWVPLVVAGIAVVGTLLAGISGAWFTRRWSDQREDRAWDRERQRERERWARDDEARTFEHRRAAYEDFYTAVKALADLAYNYGQGLTGSDEPWPDVDWEPEALEKLHRLEFYADRPVAAAAWDAYNAAWSWGAHGNPSKPRDPAFRERQQTYHDAETKMLTLMRNYLSIPEADLSLPPPGHSHE